MPQIGIDPADVEWVALRFGRQLPNVAKAVSEDESLQQFSASMMIWAIGQINLHCRRALNVVPGDYVLGDWGRAYPPTGPRLSPVVLETVWLGSKYNALVSLSVRAKVGSQSDVERARADWEVQLGYLSQNAAVLDGVVAWQPPQTGGEPRAAFTTAEGYRAAGLPNIGGML